jgi:hypothetical protein
VRGAPRVAWTWEIAQLDAGRVGILELEKIFAVDGAVGVEELVGDVGHDGSAARGDAAFGDEDQELGEELVDVNGVLELGGFTEEVGGEVEGIIGRLLEPGADGGTRAEMLKTKTKMGTRGEFPAAFAVGETVLATALLRRSWRARVALCCN